MGIDEGRHAEASIDRTRPPPPGPLRAYDFPSVVRSSLASDVPLIAARVHDFPVLTVHVLIPAGGVAEEPTLAGLASLTCALLDAGTDRRSASELAESIESLGVDLDAGASWDAAYVSLTALRSRLEPALDLLAELILQPTFPEPEVNRLRGQRIDEILQRRSDPRALATEAVARFIYAETSPFARSLSGIRSTVERITRADLVDFHAARFRPSGATVVAAGDLDPDELRRLLDDRLNGWVGAPEPLSAVDTSPRTLERQLVIVDRPGAVQSEIRVGHLGVARDSEDYFPLIVGNAILGGMFSSRLNLNLRERNGFTYGASSGFTMRRRSGAFLVSTAVQTEVTEAAIREIFIELGRIRESPVSESELTDARQYIAGIFPLRLQTTDGTASRLAELALHDLPDDYFDTYRERILSVQRDAVIAVANRHFRPDEAVVVVVGDASRLQSGLEALGIGTAEVITSEALERLPA